MLARKLGENHTVYIGRNFPSSSKKNPLHRHRVVLGVGGNVGDVRRRMEHVWNYLNRSRQIGLVQRGVILKNPPFGYTHQDDFYNTVWEVSTSLNPRALLRRLWRIEKRFGRVRSFPNAPRTLDLDILFFDRLTVNHPELSIPHPSWSERVSVIIPLRSLNRAYRREYENFNL